MTFELTRDMPLTHSLIRSAWDRPQMLRDGADPCAPPDLKAAMLFVGREFDIPVALFVGFPRLPDILDLHVCMTPMCRGAHAVQALREFFAWLPESTGYRRAVGAIPIYNRAMILVAKRAGAVPQRIERNTVMHGGILTHQLIMERRLA